MNIRELISINNGLLDMDGNPIVIKGVIKYDILLSPFYCTERDILTIGMEEPSADSIEYVRELIFNSSIIANDTFNTVVLGGMGLQKEEEFRLKRQYVICLVSYQFYKDFYKDYMRSIKKSKFLGDVKVSLDIERDPTFIMQISNDAKECYESIAGMVGLGAGIGSFVKGGYNYCNNTSDRQWFPGLDGGNPKVSIAANKTSSFCNKYKIGIK